MSDYKYSIQKVYQPASDLVVLEAGPKDGSSVLAFRPGQYLMISYQNKQGRIEDKHAFSLASSPTEKNLIRFGIRIGGSFTKGLLELKAGDELLVSGPFGNFVFDEKKYPDLVLIAGGIGITPFVSTLRYATDLQLNNKIALIYSSRTKAGTTFLEEIKACEQNNPNISVLCSFTDEPNLPAEKNMLNKRLEAQDIKNFVGPVSGKTFFLCGPVPFMVAMITNLISLGINKNQIKMEEFSMIPDRDLWSRLKNVSYAMMFAVLLFVLSFILISRSSASSNTKKTYDAATAGIINPAVYNRLIGTYEAKNQALNNLNQQILNASNGQTVNTTILDQPLMTASPVVTPPTPATRVS